MMRECPDCEGAGSFTVAEDGETPLAEPETCARCGGDGVIDDGDEDPRGPDFWDEVDRAHDEARDERMTDRG